MMSPAGTDALLSDRARATQRRATSGSTLASGTAVSIAAIGLVEPTDAAELDGEGDVARAEAATTMVAAIAVLTARQLARDGDVCIGISRPEVHHSLPNVTA